jgi:hypothetical protein
MYCRLPDQACKFQRSNLNVFLRPEDTSLYQGFIGMLCIVTCNTSQTYLIWVIKYNFHAVISAYNEKSRSVYIHGLSLVILLPVACSSCHFSPVSHDLHHSLCSSTQEYSIFTPAFLFRVYTLIPGISPTALLRILFRHSTHVIKPNTPTR